MDKLIEMALMDGVLTEKEKEILLKKAEAAGINLDEFEMILDAKLFEKQQSIKAVAPPVAAPKSDKHGDFNKCPACNAIVQSYSAICSDCGHSFSNISAVSSVSKLHEQLIAVESEERERDSKDKNQPNQSYNIFNPMASINAMKNLRVDIEEIILTRKASVIQSFPIPNSKEDILEFLTMAVPVTLIITIGASFELPPTTTNIRVVSGVFFVVALISNLIFTFINFSVPSYVITNGILLLVFILIAYSINKAKQ